MNTKPKKILVIDDEQSVRKAFMLALEDSDFQLDTAECGEAGLIKFRRRNHDLVFIDLKMPGINGVETLIEIRAENEGVPVYLITAFYKEFIEDIRRIQNKGINFELLKKPVGLDEISQITKAVLNES